MATSPRRRPLLHAATATRRCRAFEDAIAELEGAEAALRVRVGHGRDRAGRARPVLDRATTSSPSASSTPAPSCCCRRACPRFGIDVTFVDAHRARRVRRRGQPGQDHAGVRRDARPTRGSTWSTSTSSAPSPGRSRWSTRPSPRRSCSGRSTTASTWCVHSATKAHRRPQRRHARRGRRQRRAGRRSGASPCCRAPTPRRSTP